MDWHLTAKKAETSDWVDRLIGRLGWIWVWVCEGPYSPAWIRAELVGGTFADSRRRQRPRADGEEAAGGAGARSPVCSFSGRSKHLGGGERCREQWSNFIRISAMET